MNSIVERGIEDVVASAIQFGVSPTELMDHIEAAWRVEMHNKYRRDMDEFTKRKESKP